MVVGLRASTANIFIDNGPYREFIFKHFQVASVDEESAAVVLVSWSVYKRNSHLKPWVGYEWDFLPLHKSSLDNVFYKPLSHTQLHDCPIQEASYSNKHVNENHLYNLPITTTTNQQKKNVLSRLRQQTGQVIILKRANILGLSIQLGITTYILSWFKYISSNNSPNCSQPMWWNNITKSSN